MDELLKKYEKAEAPKTEEKAKEETKAEAIAPAAETKLEPAKVEEPKKEEAQEVKVECPPAEERPVKVVSEYTSTYIETLQDDGSYKSESHGKTITTKTYKDGRIVVEDRDNNSLYEDYVKKYTVTQSQLDEAVKAANDAKDVEITNLKAEIETKKGEITTLAAEKETIKIELEHKTQEIANVKIVKAEVEKPKEEPKKVDIKVGEVNNEDAEEARIKEVRDNVNKRAFGKNKKKDK